MSSRNDLRLLFATNLAVMPFVAIKLLGTCTMAGRGLLRLARLRADGPVRQQLLRVPVTLR